MNMITHTEKQISTPVNKIDAGYVMNFLQVAYPDGFIKKYGRFLGSDLDQAQLVKSIKFMIAGLSDDQLLLGMKRTRSAGYCPDVGRFVAWCMGLEKFESPEDAVKRSYIGADSALAHIINFTKGQSNFMTNAMQLAYQDTMQMFRDLEFSSSPERLVFQVYKSFKQCYFNHVENLAKQGISQSVNEDRVAIGTEKKKRDISEFIVNKSNHRPFG